MLFGRSSEGGGEELNKLKGFEHEERRLRTAFSFYHRPSNLCFMLKVLKSNHFIVGGDEVGAMKIISITTAQAVMLKF